MVGVDSGSLHMWTHSLNRLARSWVGGRLAPFYTHQMNRLNSRSGSAMIINKHCLGIIICIFFLTWCTLRTIKSKEHGGYLVDTIVTVAFFRCKVWVFAPLAVTYDTDGFAGLPVFGFRSVHRIQLGYIAVPCQSTATETHSTSFIQGGPKKWQGQFY